jgi:hypothetical protein
VALTPPTAAECEVQIVAIKAKLVELRDVPEGAGHVGNTGFDLTNKRERLERELAQWQEDWRTANNGGVHVPKTRNC